MCFMFSNISAVPLPFYENPFYIEIAAGSLVFIALLVIGSE